MFSGIIEATGRIHMIRLDGKNIHFHIEHPFEEGLYVDQSIAHDGVCLTVNETSEGMYRVSAIEESLNRSNLIDLSPGDRINLERSVRPTTFLDGHIVQGHVDTVARLTEREEREGSHLLTFSYDPEYAGLLVDKGSITLNGISLTLIEPGTSTFQVAIIPHTYHHTTMNELKIGDRVNVEFDIIGKYILRQREMNQ